jgi:cysteine desulfurase
VLQAANHEVGTTQPVDEIAGELAAHGIPIVVDASHALVYGSPPRNAPIFTGDARLWGGPAGAGILVVRRGTRWKAPFPADEAEFGRSPGAVNIPAVVAGAASLRAVWADRAAVGQRLSDFVSHIRAQVPLLVPDAVVLGDPDERLPHIVTFSCLYVEGEALLTALDRRGFAVSSGSSCTSDTLTPSHVLVAMGALTSGNIRVSLHAGVTEDEITRFLTVLAEVVAEVRAQNPGRSAAPIQLQASRASGHEPAPTDGASPKTDESPTHEIDSRGRQCPLPILDLAQNLRKVEVGEQVTILADDPAAAGDIAAWCRMRGQLLVSSSPHSGVAMAHVVRRLH